MPVVLPAGCRGPQPITVRGGGRCRRPGGLAGGACGWGGRAGVRELDLDLEGGGGVGLLTIGAFARRAGLTPKALRLYDETGLLRPAAVDAESGYRFYEPAQLDR